MKHFFSWYSYDYIEDKVSFQHVFYMHSFTFVTDSVHYRISFGAQLENAIENAKQSNG